MFTHCIDLQIWAEKELASQLGTFNIVYQSSGFVQVLDFRTLPVSGFSIIHVIL